MTSVRLILIFLCLFTSPLLPVKMYFTRHNHDWQAPEWQEQVHYLYSHGLKSSHAVAYRYTQKLPEQEESEGIIFQNPAAHPIVRAPKNTQYNAYSIICGPVHSFDYPDAAPQSRLKLDRHQTALGQAFEIDWLADACNACDQQPTVLFGVCRGACVALSTMALYDPEHIKALVVESPYHTAEMTIQSVMQNRWRIGKIPGIMPLTRSLVPKIFPQYNPEGPQTIDLVEGIRLDLPIIIICSKEDDTVVVDSSMQLYQALRRSGHMNVHILVLNHGVHAGLLRGHNGQKYQDVVHAFYKKYGLPHNALFADRGQRTFDKCQPIVHTDHHAHSKKKKKK